MSPTLSAIDAHVERCPRCSPHYRCKDAVRMAEAWTAAMVEKMEPRSAVKA